MLLLTLTLIIPDIIKTKTNNCLILHCVEENNVKHTVAWSTSRIVRPVAPFLTGISLKTAETPMTSFPFVFSL